MELNMLDLCSGSHSVSNVFKSFGWNTVTLDLLYDADIIHDVRTWIPEGVFDFVWASPPCTEYSIAKGIKYIDRNIDHSVLLACLYCVEVLCPSNWIIENPRGAMRKYLGMPLQTVYYGDYGCAYAKPTDLWGTVKIPDIHTTGTKYRSFRYVAKRSPYERSKIPKKLIEAVINAIET